MNNKKNQKNVFMQTNGKKKRKMYLYRFNTYTSRNLYNIQNSSSAWKNNFQATCISQPSLIKGKRARLD